MQFLRTAFWVILAVAIALFTKANWTTVRVKLWGDLVADAKLPVLVVGAFLLGAIPLWITLRATKWNMRRRLESLERALGASAAPLPDPVLPITPAEPLPIETMPTTDSPR
jgi:hypothetical protein